MSDPDKDRQPLDVELLKLQHQDNAFHTALVLNEVVKLYKVEYKIPFLAGDLERVASLIEQIEILASSNKEADEIEQELEILVQSIKDIFSAYENALEKWWRKKNSPPKNKTPEAIANKLKERVDNDELGLDIAHPTLLSTFSTEDLAFQGVWIAMDESLEPPSMRHRMKTGDEPEFETDQSQATRYKELDEDAELADLEKRWQKEIVPELSLVQFQALPRERILEWESIIRDRRNNRTRLNAAHFAGGDIDDIKREMETMHRRAHFWILRENYERTGIPRLSTNIAISYFSYSTTEQKDGSFIGRAMDQQTYEDVTVDTFPGPADVVFEELTERHTKYLAEDIAPIHLKFLDSFNALHPGKIQKLLWKWCKLDPSKSSWIDIFSKFCELCESSAIMRIDGIEKDLDSLFQYEQGRKLSISVKLYLLAKWIEKTVFPRM